MIPPSVAPESPPTAAPFSVVVQPTIDTVRIRNRNIFFIDHPFFFYQQVSLRGCFLAEAIFLKFRLLHQSKSEVRNDTKKLMQNFYYGALRMLPQKALRIQRRHTSRAGGGHGLAINFILNIAA